MVTVDDTQSLKVEFEQWLLEKKNFTSSNVKKTLDHLTNVQVQNFFNIKSVNSIKQIQKSVMKLKDFKRLSRITRIGCIRALQLYSAFLSQFVNDSNFIDVNIKMELSTSGSNKEKICFPKEQSTNTENDKLQISNTLSDSKYRILLNALQEDKVTTIQQLAEMNIVSYINSKNLYSWRERLEVWEDLNMLLAPYRTVTFEAEVMQEKEKCIVSDFDEEICKVDILDRKSYTYKKPLKFILEGKEYSVTCWIEVLIRVCDELFKHYPIQMGSLVGQLVGHRRNAIFEKDTKTFIYAKQLSNGLYVDSQLSAYGVLNNARTVCQKCGIDPDTLEVLVTRKRSTLSLSETSESNVEQTPLSSIGNEPSGITSEVSSGILKYIKGCGLSGCSVDDIQEHTQTKNKTVVSVIDGCKDIIEIAKDRYIHRDCVVDLDESADEIVKILKGQFEKFKGYSSHRLLYEAVRIDLPLFLNDNDFDSIENVYFLTKHLFSKEIYCGNHFVFYGNAHIWQYDPDYPKSTKGLLIHYSRMAKSFVRLEECENYLIKLGFSATNNTKQFMQITLEPTFLQYGDDRYLLSETLEINDHWTKKVTQKLGELFEDTDFVIPRDIKEEWYDELPALSFGLRWTTLLLQEIIGYYPKIGFRTIRAPIIGQITDTIHAAIVPAMSTIVTFADFVSAFWIQEEMPLKRVTAEELRVLLRSCGAIAGNELYFTLHKALNDYRFAWDNENKTVMINVG